MEHAALPRVLNNCNRISRLCQTMNETRQIRIQSLMKRIQDEGTGEVVVVGEGGGGRGEKRWSRDPATW